MDKAFSVDDTDLRRLMGNLKLINGKKMSVIAWKVGKEALFGIIKATPVAKNFKYYRLQKRFTNEPILNRQGEPIFVKDPKKYDKGTRSSSGKEGYYNPTTERRATKIATGKRYLLTAWYTARIGFKIKTGKAGKGAMAAGSFFSGDSADQALLTFENLVPYSGNQDQQKGIVEAGLRGAEDYLRKAIEIEVAKALATK